MTARLRYVAAIFLLASLANLAFAQYPTRPLRLVVPYPAEGNADVVARILGNAMEKGLGQQHVVVDARPGAVGTVGADAVAKATPDGYALLLVTGGHAVAGHGSD
jgi:tripartite-type tricarboxylate transporter receptor subunit TctC